MAQLIQKRPERISFIRELRESARISEGGAPLHPHGSRREAVCHKKIPATLLFWQGGAAAPAYFLGRAATRPCQ
jgi:hypothetical protein